MSDWQGNQQASASRNFRNNRDSAILQAPEIDPEESDNLADEELDLEALRTAMLSGVHISELAEKYPDKILRGIRQFGAQKLGEMSLQDSFVLSSFGNSTLLTRGMDTVEDVNWRANWLTLLESRAANASSMKLGWCRNVTVAAYVVPIKFAAGPRSEGLLHPMMLNIKAGAADISVLELPALQALLAHKWHTWARSTLLTELILYCTWMLCFVLFLIFFKWQGSDAWEKTLFSSTPGNFACIFNIMAFAAMVPFLVVELVTVWEYRLGWFSVWNTVDLGSYVLQIWIFSMHWSSTRLLAEDWFSVILAVQAILIFLRLQFYVRPFGSSDVSFIDILMGVLQKSGSFFRMLAMTIFSFSMAFYILFRFPLDPSKRIDQDEDQDGAIDPYEFFSTPWIAFRAVFDMMMGTFEINMLAKISPILSLSTSVFYLVYQALVGIIYLNLLIAIITEAYMKIMQNENVYRNSSRALVMDELEMTLPSFLIRKKCAQYIHFLVVKKQRQSRHPSLLGSVSNGMSLDTENISRALRTYSGKLDQDSMNALAEKVTENIKEFLRSSQHERDA